MRNKILLYYMIFFLAILSSCGSRQTKCETIQEWKVQNYKIVKTKCPDMVLAFYYGYEIYLGDKRQPGGISQTDSCIFAWQADNENYLTLNVCNNTIQKFSPQEISLNAETIDSIMIFSNELNQTQLLSNKQIEKFSTDWNNSKTRGYSKEPFDSAFSRFPAYQYRLTVFSKGTERPFYGYNYLILDSSNWEFEMNKTHDLEYFHGYWKR